MAINYSHIIYYNRPHSRINHNFKIVYIYTHDVLPYIPMHTHDPMITGIYL